MGFQSEWEQKKITPYLFVRVLLRKAVCKSLREQDLRLSFSSLNLKVAREADSRWLRQHHTPPETAKDLVKVTKV